MLKVGDRVLSLCEGFGTVVGVDGDYYDVQCDDGVIRSGGDDDIEFAEAGLLAWDEQTNGWISNEESRERYEATL